MSIRLKTILGIALIELAVLGLLLWLSLGYLQATNEAQLQGRAQATAKLVGAAITDALIGDDLATIVAVAEEATDHLEVVDHIRVYDEQDRLLADASHFWSAPLDPHLADDPTAVVGEAKVEVAGQLHGRVVVALSKQSLLKLVARVEQQLALIAGGGMLLSALFSIILGTWLVRHLRRLEVAIRALGHGAWRPLICRGNDEVGRLCQSINHMVAEIDQHRSQVRYLERVAATDHLTGLMNRSELLPALTRAMADTAESGALLAVAYMDLDGFKPINDRFGHEVGDVVLQQIARRLRRTFRQNDQLFRVGGDEFVLLISDLRNVGLAEQLLGRMLSKLTRPIEHGGQTLPEVSASLGVVIHPLTDLDGPEAVLSAADRAMYAAKGAGGARVHLFDIRHDTASRHRTSG